MPCLILGVMYGEMRRRYGLWRTTTTAHALCRIALVIVGMLVLGLFPQIGRACVYLLFEPWVLALMIPGWVYFIGMSVWLGGMGATYYWGNTIDALIAFVRHV